MVGSVGTVCRINCLRELLSLKRRVVVIFFSIFALGSCPRHLRCGYAPGTAAYKTAHNIEYVDNKPPPYYYGPADATFSPAKNKTEAESLTGYSTAAYKTAHNIEYGDNKPLPYYYGPADATPSPAKNKAEAESLTGYITAAYKTAHNIEYGDNKPPAAAATP